MNVNLDIRILIPDSADNADIIVGTWWVCAVKSLGYMVELIVCSYAICER